MLSLTPDAFHYPTAAMFAEQGLYLPDYPTLVAPAVECTHVVASCSHEKEDSRSNTNSEESDIFVKRDLAQGSNIYVASLPPSCSDTDLLELFTRFGPIVSAKVMCHRGTNTCKGYGFVLFEREADAARAQVEMIGYVVAGHKIQVRRAAAPVAAHEGTRMRRSAAAAVTTKYGNRTAGPPQGAAAAKSPFHVNTAPNSTGPYVLMNANVPIVPGTPMCMGMEGMMYMMVPVSMGMT